MVWVAQVAAFFGQRNGAFSLAVEVDAVQRGREAVGPLNADCCYGNRFTGDDGSDKSGRSSLSWTMAA